MNNKTFCIFLFIVILGCASKERTIKNISCLGEVTLQYDKIKNSDKGKPIAKNELKAFTVYFLNEFNDSIKGFVNNKLYFDKFLKITGSNDNLNNYFGYNYSKDINIPNLKIVSKTKNTCFDIEIDKRYKLVYVFLSKEGKWTVRFSNIYYLP
jgi:hypothetical protein